MSEITISMIRSRPVASAAIAIAAVGAATILGALILQYGLGLQPCPLCLEQRYAYYFAIPLALMVLVGDQVGASRKVLFAALRATPRDGGGDAVEHQPRRLSLRHRMEMVGGPAGMHGRARRSRLNGRAPQQARVDQPGALRRGRLAFSGFVACGLQRAHFAGACM